LLTSNLLPSRRQTACLAQQWQAKSRQNRGGSLGAYGLKDTVLDFPFGPNGDQTYPVKLWRNTMNCGEKTIKATYETTSKDAFARTIWNNCHTNSKVILDVHKRGHFIPKGWFAQQLDELLKPES
jgi:polyhydroxybutyrate depolymerase